MTQNILQKHKNFSMQRNEIFVNDQVSHLNPIKYTLKLL